MSGWGFPPAAHSRLNSFPTVMIYSFDEKSEIFGGDSTITEISFSKTSPVASVPTFLELQKNKSWRLLLTNMILGDSYFFINSIPEQIKVPFISGVISEIWKLCPFVALIGSDWSTSLGRYHWKNNQKEYKLPVILSSKKYFINIE